MYSKPVIFVVISFLVASLIHSSPYTLILFAAPKDPGFDDPASRCYNDPESLSVGCCWDTVNELGELDIQCQVCYVNLETGELEDCDEPMFRTKLPTGETVSPLEEGVLEQPPTPPPSGPAVLPEDGVLQQPPSQGVAPPLTRGQGVLPQDGVLQQEPTDEGTESTPRTVEPPAEDEATQPLTEPVPPCPEGQVLDEETNLCVLEEQEATEEPTTEEDQPPEESDSEEDNGNN